MTDSPSPSRARRVLRFSLLVLRLFIVWFAVIFIVAEVYARYALPESRSPIENRFNLNEQRHPMPYVMFGRPPYHGEPPSPVKPEGELRVFVLGGSTVVMGEPPFSAVLEKTLREGGLPNVRVFNWGVVSSVSGQEVARTVFQIADHAPDVVVMYNGANDVSQPILSDPRPGFPFNFLADEANPLLARDVARYPFWPLVAYGSKLLRYYFPDWFTQKFTRIEALKAEVGYMTPQWQDEIGHAYLRNLARCAAVARGLGAHFLGYFQPTAHFREPLPEAERRYTHPRNPEFLVSRRVREIVRAELPKARAEGRFEAYDLSDLFDRYPGVAFTDSVHNTQPAMQVIADRLAVDVRRVYAERKARAAQTKAAPARAEPPKLAPTK